MQALEEDHRFKISKLLESLIECVEKFSPTEERDSPFFDKNHKTLPEIHKIGSSLNEIGGYDLMLFASKAISKERRRELEFAWSGIGEWRA